MRGKPRHHGSEGKSSPGRHESDALVGAHFCSGYLAPCLSRPDGGFIGGGPLLLDQICEFGYPAIALAILLGGLGIPVSEEAVFGIAAWLIQQHRLSLAGVFAVGVSSIILVDNGGFWLGRLSRQRLARWLQDHPLGNRLTSARALLGRYDMLGISVARFIPGVRVVTGPIAGIGGLHPLRFAAPNALGAVAYVSLILSVGKALVPRIAGVIDASPAWVIVLAIGAGVLVGGWRGLRTAARWYRTLTAVTRRRTDAR